MVVHPVLLCLCKLAKYQLLFRGEKKQFDEHVNDHQVEFCKTVAERMGNIIVVENMDKLQDVIFTYDSIVSEMPSFMKSNNKRFNRHIENIVAELLGSINEDVLMKVLVINTVEFGINGISTIIMNYYRNTKNQISI